MTATLTNADGSKRIVLDGEIIVGGGLDFGPLTTGKTWLDATGGAGAGMGGYPAAYFLALENATGLLGTEHIEPGGEHDVLCVSSGLPAWGLIMDANVSAVAAIDFSKIDSPTTLAGYGITDAASDAELAAHEADTSAIHGIADTADLALVSGLAAAAYPIDASALTGAAELTGLDVAGSISAGGNLIAGGSVFAGTSGVNFTGLVGGYAPLSAIPAGAPVCTNLDADKLSGQQGWYYTNADNLNAGTVDLARGGTNADNSSQAANVGFMGPVSGGAGAMSLRALDPADIPALDASKISDFAAAVGAIAQPLDADLTLLAGITLAANQFIARSSSGAVAAKAITDFGLSLVDDANAATARTTLGLAVGTDVQAYDATLAALAGVTSTAGGMLYSTGADAFSNLANPGTASVLTHNATIPVWVSALAKAQHHAQTAFLDGSTAFSTAQTVPNLILNAAAGNTRDVFFRTSGVNRWFIRVDGSAESGSNAGSNFILTRRADDGSDLGSVVTVTRSTGAVVFSNAVTASAAFRHTGTTLGFYNVSAVSRPAALVQTYATADRTLGAYTADTESVAYTGATDGEAKLADLNALRVAYENLRAFVEDLAQHHNALVDDLQLLGLEQ